MFTLDNFYTGLQKVYTDSFIEIKEGKVLLSQIDGDRDPDENENPLWGEIPIPEIQEIIDGIAEETSFFDCMMYKKLQFEIPLRVQNRGRMPMYSYRNFDRNRYETIEHNYTFCVSKASAQYIISLICFYSTRSDLNFDLSLMYSMTIHDLHIGSIQEFVESFRIITAKVISPVECSVSEYKKMIQSYLFNISYNGNLVYDVSDFTEEQRPLRRGVRRDGQLFPYKSYKNELIRYYYQGASTDIPFTQYLAFYHVAEYFFQTIAEQDAFQEIESFITRPSFSPYKTEDVRQFYARIKKKMRDQREDGVWDEKTGLLLCLKKYVPDIESLKNSILSIDPTAVEYYENHNVPFAGEGCTVNFREASDAIYAVIRNRVYSVRNAIVHSKEGERLRYEPFKNDKDLSKEIPLIRAVAEEIIINSAKNMDMKFGE